MFNSTATTLLVLALALPLAGCQTMINQMNDCKTGDWGAIGGKDGAEGLTARFDERRAFCVNVDGGKIGADAAVTYQLGWERGNVLFWSRLGREDGRRGLEVGQFARRLAAHKGGGDKAAPNQGAYEQGWREGNAGYWRDTGAQDGTAGRPATDEQQRAMGGAGIGFNALAYRDGWRDGNYAYWERIGFQDAHDGVPERDLKVHAQHARAAGVLVREDAYLDAWNKEIIEYWRRLGWQDATDGRDVVTRRADAKARGLKFAEVQYQQQWQQRLLAYWRDAGAADGFGKPNAINERIANARRDNVFVLAETRELYNQAWSARNAEYCRVDNAFEFGRRDEDLAAEVCGNSAEGRARRAWLGGRDYEELARKLARVNRDADAAHDRRRSMQRRLERIEADIGRDHEDKNRVNNEDTARSDRKREHERKELHESLKEIGARLAELREWEFRFDQQMQQIRRDIYRD